VALLEIEGLTKTYRRRLSSTPTVAVEDVSLILEAGRTLAVVGESGAGKSTLGKLVARLVEPTSGAYRLAGIDMLALRGRRLRAQRRRVQVVFQDPYTSFDPRMTIGASLEEPLLIHEELDRARRRSRIVELARRVGLEASHLDRRPHQLSGGQLQRIAIARALSVQPELIVFDEPVAALDVSIRAHVLNLMADLQAELGTTYLFITHDLSTVRVLADEILVMRRGRAIEHAPAAQLFVAPSEEYTRALLDAVPSPVPRTRTARREGARLSLSPGPRALGSSSGLTTPASLHKME